MELTSNHRDLSSNSYRSYTYWKKNYVRTEREKERESEKAKMLYKDFSAYDAIYQIVVAFAIEYYYYVATHCQWHLMKTNI